MSCMMDNNICVKGVVELTPYSPAGSMRIAAHHGLRAAGARVAARGRAARRRVRCAVRRRRARRAAAPAAQAQPQL